MVNFATFLQDQAAVKDQILLQSLPTLLAYQAQDLAPDVAQVICHARV